MSFDVALTDADGDTVVSPDAIAVHLQEPPPVTNADTVITNVGANAAVAIPTAWLLANDEGSTLSVTGVGGAIGGSVSGPTGGNVTFTDDATLDGSFTYQANNGSVSGNAATVTINNNTTATTTLIGERLGNHHWRFDQRYHQRWRRRRLHQRRGRLYVRHF